MSLDIVPLFDNVVFMPTRKVAINIQSRDGPVIQVFFYNRSTLLQSLRVWQ